MIKVTKYFYINILTVLLFIFCTFSHSLDILVITYSVMTVHELAHTIAAVCIGLKVSRISFHPFGVNLKLKNKMVYSLCDEIILYASGPLCNIVLAFAAILCFKSRPNEYLRFFYAANIALFVMNMLPAMPLDGGIILKKILARAWGSKAADKVMRVISAVTAALVASLGIYVLAVTRFNFSILLFSSLLVGNMFTQREKYNIDFIKKVMFSDKKTNKIKHIIAKNDEKTADIAKQFRQNGYYIVYITDKNGKIENILTEKQIINSLIGK